MMDYGKETILELDGIVKKYRNRGFLFGAHGQEVVALNGFSIKIMRGEIFGLVGESGSGKTTAGRLIVRLEQPGEGKIYLDGLDIIDLKGKAIKDYSRRVQLIFQDPYQSLNPQFSVFDTISEPLIIHKIGNTTSREEAVFKVMKSVGLSPPQDFAHRFPHQLSGGQRQRIAIARAMVLNPEFVVADEPTSMLDASMSAQIFKILLEMRKQFNVTFLFITHSLATARYLCERIAVMYKGNVMEIGPADQVLKHPKHPYTQALIDALPQFGHFKNVNRYDTLLRSERTTSGFKGCPFFPRCKHADPIKCRDEKPLLRRLGESHSAACFYA
ncbi:MAG: oligopeptide/dipeptide ABC transporter ATP-binding protein [Thermodesulfobacteriota bacterium]